MIKHALGCFIPGTIGTGSELMSHAWVQDLENQSSLPIFDGWRSTKEIIKKTIEVCALFSLPDGSAAYWFGVLSFGSDPFPLYERPSDDPRWPFLTHPTLFELLVFSISSLRSLYTFISCELFFTLDKCFQVNSCCGISFMSHLNLFSRPPRVTFKLLIKLIIINRLVSVKLHF